MGAAVGEVWELAWSPDGTKIGYVSDVGGPFQEELWTSTPTAPASRG